ncbi:DUF2274 domain-containing protein [Hyphococcus sp.]|uniref:DUF2274 domain-containing protein n=1 Tax=Hyphococcus sp. TaxID=2038636 RepID=UPI0035C66213
MSLKIGAIPDRTPVKVTASLPPDVYEALQDYAAIHAREFGQEASPGDLAALMIERFLSSDAAFRRARKSLHQSSSKEE